MKIIRGDLIQLAKDKTFDVVVHGCNCQNNMGAGIALQIKKAFPEAYKADCATIVGDIGKLGKFSCAQIDGVYVVNAYTQFNLGPDVMYSAVRASFKEIKQSFSGLTIAYPKIGAGISGGEWGYYIKNN